MPFNTLLEKNNSSFLAVAKDNSLIMQKLLENKSLLKLLYYADRDWKSHPDLTSEQIKSLLDKKQISLVPNLTIDEDGEKLSYLRITYDDFVTASDNNFYRDCVIEFSIICHFQDWELDNYCLRPYEIAGRIDSMIADGRLSGIGKVIFLSG